ncbi:hypothetical protein ACGYTX_08375 [Burkholderia pseudomallei]
MPTTHYVGKAGHLAVTGELCLRGYNVAMPEIDKGDDIFVVRDDSGAMWRLQVKTSLGSKPSARRWRYQFRIRNSAIQNSQTPELHFVFVMRKGRRTWRYLIMDRAVLRNYVNSQSVGSEGPEYTQLWITLGDEDGRTIATCSKVDLSHHLEDWNTWPEL